MRRHRICSSKNIFFQGSVIKLIQNTLQFLQTKTETKWQYCSCRLTTVTSHTNGHPEGEPSQQQWHIAVFRVKVHGMGWHNEEETNKHRKDIPDFSIRNLLGPNQIFKMGRYFHLLTLKRCTLHSGIWRSWLRIENHQRGKMACIGDSEHTLKRRCVQFSLCSQWRPPGLHFFFWISNVSISLYILTVRRLMQ